MMNEGKCRHLNSVPDLFCAFCNMKTPPSLKEMCLEYVSNNVGLVAEKNPRTSRLELKEGVSLPGEIWENLLTQRTHINKSVKAEFINIFRDTETTKLKRVKLREENINKEELEVLLAHKLVELDISKCELWTRRNIQLLSKCGSRLESFSVESNRTLFPSEFFGHVSNFYRKEWHSIIDTPSLRRLIFRDIRFLHVNFFKLLLAPMKSLTHLDLSSCSDLGTFKYSEHLTNLTSLVLYDMENMEDKISAICALTNLKHLDISQSDERLGNYINPNETLASIVECLPFLTSLDISGTNLAGIGVAEEGMENSGSDIPGLVLRGKNPLEFLGLYRTSHNACSRNDIPARRISGHSNEEQLLISALTFYDRPKMLQKVLRDMVPLLQDKKCNYIGQLLNIVLEAMNRHVSERKIQVVGSLILFYIVRGTMSALKKTVRTRKKIIATLINSLTVHIGDVLIKQHCRLVLAYFQISDPTISDLVAFGPINRN